MQIKLELHYYFSQLLNTGGAWGVKCISAYSCHHFRRQEATWHLLLTNSSTNKALLSLISSVCSYFPFLDKPISYILSITAHLQKAWSGQQDFDLQTKSSKWGLLFKDNLILQGHFCVWKWSLPGEFASVCLIPIIYAALYLLGILA